MTRSIHGDRRRRNRRPLAARAGAAALLVAAALAPLASARAASSDDADWPCIQRKVPRLSLGQMWSGPAAEGDWQSDRDIATLAHRIASRRTDMAEAEALVTAFASESGEQRAARLSLLYAGVFSVLDHERAQVIDGIARYTKRQRQLAERIGDESLKLLELKQGQGNPSAGAAAGAAAPEKAAPETAAPESLAPESLAPETAASPGAAGPGSVGGPGGDGLAAGPVPAAAVAGVVIMSNAAPPLPTTQPELEQALAWDTRIYEEREQSLTYVCEVPVLVEQRAFALGRMIQGKIGD